MFCKECGKEIKDNAFVCPYCGVKSGEAHKKKNIFDWFLACWGKATNSKGRASREEFWSFFIINIAIIYILDLLMSGLGYLYAIISGLFPFLTVTIRRLHDVGKSGWWVFVPIYNIILCCYESDADSNEYGDNPNIY